MPVAVIEGLEVVEIDCDDKDLPEPPVAREPLEDPVKAAAVEDTGQRISSPRSVNWLSVL